VIELNDAGQGFDVLPRIAQVISGIGMAIGLAPVIGIPLPFFSYGGSSLWAFTALLFILLKMDTERLIVLR